MAELNEKSNAEIPRPTSAELWNQREPEKRGPKIAPIWVVIGLTVVAAGILFGQMFAPSGATASEGESTPAPQPSVTASPFGAASPMATDSGGRVIRKLHGRAAMADGTASPAPAPVATDPDAQRVATDQSYAGGAWPSAGQLVTEGDTSGGMSTPQPVQTPAVVVVYSRDAPSSAGSAAVPPYPAYVSQAATNEGDNTGRSERGGTELPRMKSELMTPAPLTVPAGTRIPATLDVPTDSDLGGPVIAHPLEDVCDPRTGDLAWPRGAAIIGHLESVVSSDQRHLAFAWDSLRYPDLTRRSLAGSTATEDEEGHTGVAGRRNAHTWTKFRDTLIGSVANSAGQVLSNLTARVGAQAPVVVVPQNQGGGAVSRAADIPTIEIGRTTRFDLVLLSDFTADGPYDEPGWTGCRS